VVAAACVPDGGVPIALLLRPAGPVPPQVLAQTALSGVVRRRIGRQSLPARGHLVGGGFSVAAGLQRRPAAAPPASLGEDGALRLYQTVPWRKGKHIAAKPTAVSLVPDLGGPDRDGLLLVGAGDGGPVHLLLGFDGRAVRAYP